jgi:hypothetical protein
MMRVRSSGWWIMAALFGAFSQPALLACTACFGKSDSNMARGMNMGIFALLVVITTVLCGVAGFFAFLAKRSNELENAQVPQTFSSRASNHS